MLLVEDDVVQVKAYKALGKRFGMQVMSTPRLDEAFSLAVSEKPDVIVLDYRLEEGESLPLLTHLRQTPQLANTPVLVISAYLSSELRKHCMALGATQVMDKPWTVDELLEALSPFATPPSAWANDTLSK